MQQELAALILNVVAEIPYGCVTSYGHIARLAGLPRHARLVGYVLKNLDATSDLPWHRVVNSRGEIRTETLEQGQNKQAQLLLQEGIVCTNYRVDLRKYGWQI